MSNQKILSRVRKNKTGKEIALQAERLRAEAERRYGTRFTTRNLRITEAYNSVMNQFARRQVEQGRNARANING